MHDTVLKIALAGLMHDIGKFAQGSLSVSNKYIADNAGLYQPFWDGRHTHVHAVYTAAFIEQMADRLPEQLNRGGWGEGDSFVNLAAGHHKPETPMQWIITIADRISSGLDRDSFEEGEKIAFQEVKKTRLLPILEQLDPENPRRFRSRNDFRYCYSLSPLSAKSIFPYETEDISRAEAQTEYKELFNYFLSALCNLYHKNENIYLWCQHLDSLL